MEETKTIATKYLHISATPDAIDQNGSKTFCCRKIQNQTLKYSTVNYDVLNLVFYTFFRLKQNSTVGER